MRSSKDVRAVLRFLLFMLFAWVLLAWPAAVFFDSSFWVTGIAAGVSSAAGVVVFAVVALSRKAEPVVQLGLGLALGMIRLTFVVGVGGFGYYLVPSLQKDGLGFVLWSSVFYLLALTSETLLVYRRETSSQ